MDAPNEASSVKRACQELPRPPRAGRSGGLRATCPLPSSTLLPSQSRESPRDQPGWTHCWPAWVGTAFPRGTAAQSRGDTREGPLPPPTTPRCGISEISFPVTIRRQVFLFLNPSPVAILVCVSRSGIFFFFSGTEVLFFAPGGGTVSSQPPTFNHPPPGRVSRVEKAPPRDLRTLQGVLGAQRSGAGASPTGVVKSHLRFG